MALHECQITLLYIVNCFQPPKSIIAQTKLPRPVPIHTISFNCNDREANEFLYELAKDTGGRFHYYSQDGCEIDLDGPEPWQVDTRSQNIIITAIIIIVS